MTTRVRIKEDCRHIVGATEKARIEGKMTDVPLAGGRFAEAGEEIDVTDAELAAYPDKFIVLGPPPARRGRPPKADVEG